MKIIFIADFILSQILSNPTVTNISSNVANETGSQ